jgi:hypothetical protein
MTNYDSNKRYTWTPEDKFELSGQEFGLLLNTVRTFLASEEAGKYQLMMKANDVIEKLMAQGVENNIIKEISEEPSSKTPSMEVIK